VQLPTVIDGRHGSNRATGQRQAIVILDTLFSWLVNAGYLAGNPLLLSRLHTRKAKPAHHA